MNNSHTFIIALGAILTACAPLQQAPLVYVSKIAVGIDLSSTSTESPGISLTLGYKQVDAAYVPVAVAKPCDDKVVGIDCTNAAYRLSPISGTSDTQGTRRSGPSEEEAKKAIADYDAALKKVAASKASRDAASDRITTLNKRRAELEAKTAQFNKQKPQLDQAVADKGLIETKRASTSLSAEELKRLDLLDAQIKAGNALKPTDDETKEVSEIGEKNKLAQLELTRASGELIALEAAADQLRPQAKAAEQMLNKLERHDAFSVYGRFESTTGVEASKASVGLGKVFSTGVASQNLSQGLGDYYKGIGMAACYEAVAKLSDKITDATKLEKLIADCRASTINDTNSR